MAAPTDYAAFFRELTGHARFPYQERLARDPWPEIIDVPTGLGKTQAVITAFLYRRLHEDPGTGRRLVYCLPMRVLVEQTVAVAEELCRRATDAFAARGLRPPTVHPMLGGFSDEAWERAPDVTAILVGTQDMLVSRALNRGYAMSRFKWPVHFGLLNNDCMWVMDETQLMGVAVETSAQLEGLRRRLGAWSPIHTIWMSATMGRAQLMTPDHPEPSGGYRILDLAPADREHAVVRQRTGASKKLTRADLELSPNNQEYARAVADLAARAHQHRGGLTLVLVNRVARAQEVYRALRSMGVAPLGLVHSRFRQVDRERQERLLWSDGDRVVVATQAVEAGVDVSARTMITELAPWPSLVQRFGRCNRYGEEGRAEIAWIDIPVEADARLSQPYLPGALIEARRILSALHEAGPDRLRTIPYAPSPEIRPVLRHRDLIDLFDTTPDLLGHDVDVSRFVRDTDDSDVLVYWREFETEPSAELTTPASSEMVRVTLPAARDFLDKASRKRKSLGQDAEGRERRRWLTPWTLDTLGARSPWTRATAVYPGQILLLHPRAGGYDPDLGWTGDLLPGAPVPEVDPDPASPPASAALLEGDPEAGMNRWVHLTAHLSDVAQEAERLCMTLGLPDGSRVAVTTAARWHDVGKAHEEFQRRLVEPVQDDPEHRPPGPGPWAKSSHSRRPPRDARPFFRHELASALAWLQCASEAPSRDLVGYLIAAHHGKIRLSIRSVPGERGPKGDGRPFARGIWDGDELPAVELPDGTSVGPLTLGLSLMQLGEGSWLERTLALRDDPELGPFRLAFLESLLRVADWRGSDREQRDA